MTVGIFGAPSLSSFTEAVARGFREAGAAVRVNGQGFAEDLLLAQIHGSPAAAADDERIAKLLSSLGGKTFVLVHRPDEALLNPVLSRFFETTTARFIFLGDLVLEIPFWEEHAARITVIPHPFLDLTMPEGEKPVVGAFTSWGEMRKLEHFVSLAEKLPRDRFEFRIGGPGIEKNAVPDFVRIADRPFVPHFNVQLYHLNGRKRYGESSGSLHRGISVPVIFEANGAERLENLRAVKIAADEDLREIDFETAAREIASMDLNEALNRNRASALKNTTLDFARAVLSI